MQVEPVCGSTAALQRNLIEGACGVTLLLIDPFLGEPPGHELGELPAAALSSVRQLAEARSAAWGGRGVTLCDEPSPIKPRHVLPYMVSVERPDDPLIAEIAELAADEHRQALTGEHACCRVGGLLQADLSAPQVMQRLQTMWRYKGTAMHPKDHRYLRLADRRVMLWLREVLGVPALRQWLGPIDAWHVLDRNFRWVMLDGTREDDHADESALLRRHDRRAQALLLHAQLRPSAQELAALNACEAVSRTLTALQAAADDQRLADGAHARAWRAVQEAQHEGLMDAEDIAAWAWRRLAYPHKSGHAQCRQCLQRTLLEQTPLGPQLQALGEAFWREPGAAAAGA